MFQIQFQEVNILMYYYNMQPKLNTITREEKGSNIVKQKVSNSLSSDINSSTNRVSDSHDVYTPVFSFYLRYQLIIYFQETIKFHHQFLYYCIIIE